MEDIDKLLSNIDNLDLNDILFAMWSRNDTQDYIVELNTVEQLYNEGIRSDDSEIGQYTDNTKQMKTVGSGDSRIDHITLKDTGAFYKSFKIKPNKKGFKIIANPNKDDTNLFEEFGVDIVGLTKDNVFKLLDFIEPMFNEEVERRVFQ
jgi:hypothetical protein